LFLFKKEKIKGGEKRKRKNLFLGDFDVFASSALRNPPINSLVASKKQMKRKTPTHPQLLRNCPLKIKLDIYQF